MNYVFKEFKDSKNMMFPSKKIRKFTFHKYRVEVRYRVRVSFLGFYG